MVFDKNTPKGTRVRNIAHPTVVGELYIQGTHDHITIFDNDTQCIILLLSDDKLGVNYFWTPADLWELDG